MSTDDLWSQGSPGARQPPWQAPRTPSGQMSATPQAPPVQRPEPDGQRGRGGPRWLTWLPYALVVCGAVGGLTLVALNHYKRGSALLAAAALLGALARLTLPDRQVGLLASRRKSTDVLIMVAFAIGIATVAWVVRTPK